MPCIRDDVWYVAMGNSYVRGQRISVTQMALKTFPLKDVKCSAEGSHQSHLPKFDLRTRVSRQQPVVNLGNESEFQSLSYRPYTM